MKRKGKSWKENMEEKRREETRGHNRIHENEKGKEKDKVQAGSHMELLRGVIEMHEGPEQETKDQRAMG